MQPIGPLMWEHRTIERGVKLMAEALRRMRQSRMVEPRLLELGIDFIRTYADRTHHGKEEGILFRELAKKPLDADLRSIMDELVAEHVHGRALTRRVSEGIEHCRSDAAGGLEMVTEALEQLCLFYPAHIEKEDTRFFHQIMKYFDRAEMDRMLQEYREFDSQLIHERYKARLHEMQHAAGLP